MISIRFMLLILGRSMITLLTLNYLVNLQVNGRRYYNSAMLAAQQSLQFYQYYLF